MNRPEAVMLCRYVKACCPQQAIDEYTPDAWFDLLGALAFDDCKAAVIALAQRQPFVAPAEIKTEVKRLRRDRIVAFGPLLPPAELDGDPAETNRWLVATTKRIGDGEITDPAQLDTYGELTSGVVPELRNVLRAVDE